MIKTNLFNPTQAHSIVTKKGRFSLLEYSQDMSVSPEEAQKAYFCSQMNVHRRQVIAELNNGGGVILQSGAMQMIIGNIELQSDIKGAGDMMKKLVGSKVTGESAVKPKYTGSGLLVLEPTYKHILFEDISDWNGKMVIEDGLFLACDDSISLNIKRASMSTAMFSGEGMFNTLLSGLGIVVLESPVPAEELIVVDLENDVLKIDGSYAIAWSNTLDFTVERSSKGLVSSAASGEGLVNVYRGTGRVLIAPVAPCTPPLVQQVANRK